MSAAQPAGLEPPRWPRNILRFVLPSCATCDAILGDLREEFAAEARRVGPRAARARYRRRVVGVAAYALRDLLCWRGWNDSPRAERSIGASRTAGVRRAARNLRRSLHAVRGLADYRLVAVAVLAVGIGSNVSLFTLARGALPRPMVGVLAGIGLVLLIACAHLASVTLCAGLRRRRDRPRA